MHLLLRPHVVVLAAALGCVATALRAQPATAAPPDQQSAATLAGQDPYPVWLQVSLNGQPLGTELLVRDGSQIWVDPALLALWRLALPPDALWRILPEGRLVSLCELPGLRCALDEGSQHLLLSGTAEALQHSQLEARRVLTPPPQAAAAGSFLNYDLSATVGDGDGTLGGAFEWGVFGPSGVATTTFLAGDSAFGDARLVRLETAWTRHDARKMRTLTLGDAISAAGSFGRARRFAGVQWGSNFALQPDLVTFALPSASGSSTVPTTVDVYVDQVLRLREEVPAGPFELSGLPVTVGTGQTELVITDALGRQQRLPFSFYTSAALLRPGLRAWQYSAGLARERFGQDSFDYGDPVFSGSERYGFNDHFTGEWHGEWTPDQVRTGVGASWLKPGLGIVQWSLAGSHAGQGSGVQAALALERRARALSFSANVGWSSRHFDAAALPSERTPRLRQQAALSWSLGAQGALSLGWLRQRRYDGSAVQIASLGYSRRLGRFGLMNLSMQHLAEPEDAFSVALSVIVPLEAQQSVSFSMGDDAGDSHFRVDLQRSPPAGEGFGYRVLAEAGDRRRLDAGVVYQGTRAILRAELSQLLRQSSGRVQASGGLLLLGGSLHASRPLTDSFALVDVAGYPGVRIYADNQEVATTGADGRALVPRLRPWQRNELRVEQGDLPLDARVDALTVDAVPPARSGLDVRFAVQRQRSASLRLVLDDGQPVPAGSQVLLSPAVRILPLGLDGRIFADDLAAGDNRLRLSWGTQVCEVALSLPAGEVQPDLGVLTCSGVQR